MHLSKQRKIKYLKLLAPTLLVILVVFLMPRPASANWLIDDVLGKMCIYIIDLLGGLLIALIQMLIGVAQYNDFINSPAVTFGWVVLRDLCNMFFVIILLVIAFATVLGVEKYSYKKFLLPLILMAILINFSKSICGIIIDVAQVAMMQFVDGFKYAAAGNLTTAFGLNDLLAMRDLGTNAKIENMDTEVFVSLMLGVALLVVSVVVTGILLIVFLIRILALWILVMISPVAYLAQATPGQQSYSNEWWKQFTNYVISGPVLAFFLWVSLSIISINPTPGGISETTNVKPTDTGESVSLQTESAEAVAVGISKIGTSNQLIGFAVAIGMLIASLTASKRLGVAGSDLAMKGKAKLESAGKKFAKVGLGIGALTVGGAGAYMGYQAAKGWAIPEIKHGTTAAWNRFSGLPGVSILGLSKKQREEGEKARQERWHKGWLGKPSERADWRQSLFQQQAKETMLSSMTLEDLQAYVEKTDKLRGGARDIKGTWTRRSTMAKAELQKRGYYAGVDTDNPDERKKAETYIQDVRTAFATNPEMLNAFDKGIMTQSATLAYETIFGGLKTSQDITNLQAQITQGNIKASNFSLSVNDERYTQAAKGMYLKAAKDDPDREKRKKELESFDTNIKRRSDLELELFTAEQELKRLKSADASEVVTRNKEFEIEDKKSEMQNIENYLSKIGAPLGNYYKSVLDESELSNFFRNLSRERRDTTFRNIKPEDFSTKEKGEAFARATGLLAQVFDMSNNQGMLLAQKFLEDNKESFTKNINTSTFIDQNGKPLKEAMEALTKVLKASEIMNIAKKDKKLSEAMAKANKEALSQFADDYSKGGDAQKYRELQVKLSGGVDIGAAYNLDVDGAKVLLDESFRTGGIKGNDLYKVDPAKVSQPMLRFLASMLKVEQMRAAMREGNVKFFDKMDETLENLQKEANSQGNQKLAGDLEKKLNKLRRGESYIDIEDLGG